MSIQMKQFKSSYQDLRALYNNISVKHVLEPLQSCRADDESTVIRKRMEELDFDVMGVEENGQVYGYVERSTLAGGPCAKYGRTFHPSELITESTSLADVFSVLYDNPRIFVLKGTRVMGIVTRGDLQKSPVRMWIFGLVTLIEMNLLFIVRARYPNDSWKNHISEARLRKANDLFDGRKKKNEAIDLADCLQFCDKADLVLEVPDIKQKIEYGLKTSPQTILDSAEDLRDILAHAQDLVVGSTWTDRIDLMREIEELLNALEQARE